MEVDAEVPPDLPIHDATLPDQPDPAPQLNDVPISDQPDPATTPEQIELPVMPTDEDDGALLYPGETPIMEEISDEDLSDIYNQFQVEDDSDYEFEKIVDHKWKDGILIFTARFQGATDDGHIMEVPFPVLKKDVPLKCAKYIKNYVIDSSSRGSGRHTSWATTILKQHSRTVRRLSRAT